MSDTFIIQTAWLNNDKPFTYADYSREYKIICEGKPELIGSAAPAYKGAKEHYNPEDLLVAAISGCHMLSYLALAANSKIQIIDYTDTAEGFLAKHGMSMKFDKVILRPKITIASDADQSKAIALHEKAHDICFIANSVNFEVLVEPSVEFA